MSETMGSSSSSSAEHSLACGSVETAAQHSAGEFAWTPRQRELARHALGLPNDQRRSYRNRFYAGPGSADWHVWCALTDAGLAVIDPGGRYDLFLLTRTAAEAVLQHGESLDLEDFPHD